MSSENDIWTGIREIDSQILLYLNDIDIYNICLASKYLKSLCDDDNFWKLRFIKVFDKKNTKCKEGKWRDKYIDKKKINSRLTIHNQELVCMTKSDHDYKKAQIMVNEFIKDIPLWRQRNRSLIRKIDMPYLKDGDVYIRKGGIFEMGIVTDVGQYLMRHDITIHMKLANNYTLIRLSKCVTYHLFKHGCQFFIPISYYASREDKSNNKPVKLEFICEKGYKFKSDNGFGFDRLIIKYDENGNLTKTKDKKIYTYGEMKLVLRYEHEIWCKN
jgi:hypothetical protein